MTIDDKGEGGLAIDDIDVIKKFQEFWGEMMG